MEVKMQVKEIVKLYNTLSAVIDDTNTQIDMPMKFHLLLIMKTLSAPVETYEKMKADIILELGTKNDKGEVGIDVKDKKQMKKFNDALEELGKKEFTVTYDKIPANDIMSQVIPAVYLEKLLDVIKM